MSERTFRRWRQRYEEDGADGLVDRRVGQRSPKRALEDELERMRALYLQHYQGGTIKHFHEKLAKRLGYTTTRLYLQKTGTVPPAPKGLEFKAVAVMACDDDVLPLQERIETASDEAELEEVYDTERHLLYVACTRARDQVLVTGVAPASEFLEDMKGAAKQK